MSHYCVWCEVEHSGMSCFAPGKQQYLAACRAVVELADLLEEYIKLRTHHASLPSDPDYQRAKALKAQYETSVISVPRMP